LVYDLVYNPPQTPLIRAAKEAGAGVIGGLEMLIRQAEAQFEIWAGSQPPAGVMEEAARRYFGNAKTGGAAE
jgi:shikimate dehydrogenase